VHLPLHPSRCSPVVPSRVRRRLRVDISTEEQSIGGARRYHAKFGLFREFREQVGVVGATGEPRVYWTRMTRIRARIAPGAERGPRSTSPDDQSLERLGIASGLLSRDRCAGHKDVSARCAWTCHGRGAIRKNSRHSRPKSSGLSTRDHSPRTPEIPRRTLIWSRARCAGAPAPLSPLAPQQAPATDDLDSVLVVKFGEVQALQVPRAWTNSLSRPSPAKARVPFPKP
jgi:hypothetical protein